MGTIVLLATAGKYDTSEFDAWREERPFWGGVLLILASFVIGWIPLQFTFELLLIGGAYTAIGLVFGVVVFLSGVFALMRPELSRIVGITGIAFSLLSLIGALGGMFVGLVIGLVGGNLCLAWEGPSEVSSGHRSSPAGAGAGASTGGTASATGPGSGSGSGFGGLDDTTAPSTASGTETDDRGSSGKNMKFSWQENPTGNQPTGGVQSRGSGSPAQSSGSAGGTPSSGSARSSDSDVSWAGEGPAGSAGSRTDEGARSPADESTRSPAEDEPAGEDRDETRDGVKDEDDEVAATESPMNFSWEEEQSDS